MPVLKYLADTNSVSDYFRPGNPVRAWFAAHPGEIGISTLTLAEIRRGIELKGHTKARLALERTFSFVLQDYRHAIFSFDEAAALEWGRLMSHFSMNEIAKRVRVKVFSIIYSHQARQLSKPLLFFLREQILVCRFCRVFQHRNN